MVSLWILSISIGTILLKFQYTLELSGVLLKTQT